MREKQEGELVRAHRLESLREIYELSDCESEDCLKRQNATLCCTIIF